MKQFVAILAIFFSTFAMAQNDAKAEKILDSMAQKFQKYSGMEVEFALTMENLQEDIKERSKGKAWAKGNKYKIDLMGVETYFDGKTVWSFIKEADEVNISEPNENDPNSFNPSKLFSSYKEGYKIRYKREVFQNNRALHIINLYPKDIKGSEFSMIVLKIDKDKNQPYKIIRKGKDGNNYTVTLFKVTPKEGLKDALFTFNPKEHPDVELIDLRE